MKKMLAGAVIIVFIFLVISTVYVMRNPLVDDANYKNKIYDSIGIEVKIPKDCIIESEQVQGFQCKSSKYTYDKGQKEGYLITVAALPVRDVNVLGPKGSLSKVMTGLEAWEYSLSIGGCGGGGNCTKKTILNYPAVSSSRFSADERISSFNSESTYIFKDGVQYALSVRAVDQISGKQILHQMERSLLLKGIPTSSQ